MKAVRGIIIASALFLFWATTAHAWDRGNRNVSSSGEFSFHVESYGSPLPVYNYRGRSYIEGMYGNSYAIRVFNHTGRRVEAVVTVDGRDVISGQVGNYRDNRGYVIEPYNSVLIEGFRSSWNNVASFTFTDIGDSYAARMGDASNVGVIGVAVFKEESYRPAPPPPIYRYDRSNKNRGQGLGTGYGRSSAPAEKSAEAAPSSPSRSRSYEMDDSYGQGLGTGYGDDTYSPSTNTHFDRTSRRPTAVLAIRYDDREGLYARGVLTVPRPEPYRYRAPVRPEPFPETPVFAPPPPPRWWE